MRIAADRKVFQPKSLNDALAIIRRRPGPLVFAGGSEFQNLYPGEPTIDRDILALHNIEELKRIYRSDRMLEIGSMVTLERLSRFGGDVIPKGFAEAILTLPHAPVRSIATIGGNLLVHPRYFSLAHYLTMVDASVELKRSGGGRWLPVMRLRDGDNNPQLHQELLTKIRIPVNQWNHQNFRRFYSRERELDYGICALASVHRGIIEDIRIAYLFRGLLRFQNRNSDSQLIGRRVPIPERDLRNYINQVEAGWAAHPSYALGDDLVHRRLLNLSVWFIHSLNNS
jgi:CO/xanthine dehydrogenase FAD-binding subunit